MSKYNFQLTPMQTALLFICLMFMRPHNPATGFRPPSTTVVSVEPFSHGTDTAVPAEGNGDLQTLICVLVARPRRCPTLSNPVPTKANGGLSQLHSADEDAVSWPTSYGP